MKNKIKIIKNEQKIQSTLENYLKSFHYVDEQMGKFLSK